MSKQQACVFPAQYPDGDEMICDQASVRSQQQNDHHLVTIPVEEIETNFAEILGKSLRPLLLSFKFIGIYCGQTKFETCSLGDDSRKFSSKYSFEKIYCVFVLMVICSSLVAGIITLSYHEYYDINRLFITISHCVWFMHTNFNVLACLALLPCGARKSSRFQKLLFHRFTVYVSGRTAKSSLVSKTLVFAWFFIIANLAMILLFDIFTNVSLIKLPPWNNWPFASLVVHNIMNIYNMSVWILPLVFYVIFCKQLSLLFDNLKTAVSLKVEQGTLTFKSLRHKHEKLCGLVEAADKVLSSIAFSIYAGHIPMTCLLFNQLTKFDYGEKNEVLVLVSYLSWGSISVAIVSLVSYFAAVVNSKIHGFYDLVQQARLPTRDHEETGELVLFLTHLKSGDPIGLTIGGLVVITKSMFFTSGDPIGLTLGRLVVTTKSMFFTVVSLIATYLMVLVQFK